MTRATENVRHLITALIHVPHGGHDAALQAAIVVEQRLATVWITEPDRTYARIVHGHIYAVGVVVTAPRHEVRPDAPIIRSAFNRTGNTYDTVRTYGPGQFRL